MPLHPRQPDSPGLAGGCSLPIAVNQQGSAKVFMIQDDEEHVKLALVKTGRGMC